MVRGNRIDGNQHDIVGALRTCGYRVIITSKLGDGYPDLNVVSKSGITVLMELKMPGETLTPKEKLFMASFDGVYHICYSAEDALEYMTRVDKMRIV